MRVAPQRMGASRRGKRRPGKSDEIDALAIARAVAKDGIEDFPAAPLDEQAMDRRCPRQHPGTRCDRTLARRIITTRRATSRFRNARDGARCESAPCARKGGRGHSKRAPSTTPTSTKAMTATSAAQPASVFLAHLPRVHAP